MTDDKEPKLRYRWLWPIVCLLAVVAAALTWGRWLPATRAWVARTTTAFRTTSGQGSLTDSHAGHSEDETDNHAGQAHDEEDSLVLSPQAMRNVGLTGEWLREVILETYLKTLTVPAVVIEKPGRTRIQISTPMTGVVTDVDVVAGEAVNPGERLFKIRLTHEDLVQAQTGFLTTLGELDVERREIARLEQVTRSGAIAGKVLLNRQYARDKLLSLMRAQQEALRLHGLSDEEVRRIATERRLLRALQVFAPVDGDQQPNELRLSKGVVRQIGFEQDVSVDGTGSESRRESLAPAAAQRTLILQSLNVKKGQTVNAGDALCTLAAFDELYIEGLAFEQDIGLLRKASSNDWTVEAVFDETGDATYSVSDLKIVYLANEIDTESRTLHFYVALPNETTKDRRAAGNRFVEWKYLPGQRLQLRVPIEKVANQIVLPVDAVAREGAEYFVFRQNGKKFDRIPVHARHRDQYSVVIENDGALFPGDTVAMRGAHQLQMAMKNKAGGGVDPHAGHSH